MRASVLQAASNCAKPTKQGSLRGLRLGNKQRAQCVSLAAARPRRPDAPTLNAPEMDPEDSSAHSSADGEDWEEESAADDLVERAERGALCVHELDLAVYRGATDALDVRRTVSLEGVRTFLLCRVRASRGSAFGRVPDAVCRLIVAIAGGLFLAADAFGGRREGMVFKLGEG